MMFNQLDLLIRYLEKRYPSAFVQNFTHNFLQIIFCLSEMSNLCCFTLVFCLDGLFHDIYLQINSCFHTKKPDKSF